VNPVDITEHTGTIGLPIPSTEISIRDEQDHELPAGTPGEICARGPQVTPGYWRRDEATREVMTDDGFFRTGDIGSMDERGFIKIIDRKKDMIVVSGFNVYPNEVEDVAASMDEILECACIGTPDERTGEAVTLCVVPKSGRAVTAEQIRACCKTRLAAYKVPSRVEFLGELPKSNVGKILRRKLRELWLSSEL
jgi:long-chain acyl-CoA synthetase